MYKLKFFLALSNRKGYNQSMEHTIYDISSNQWLKSPLLYEYSGISQTLPLHTVGPLKKKTHQIHVVFDGEGTLSINNKLYKIKKGGVFFLPADSYFSYQSDSLAPWSYVWIGFSCDETVLSEIMDNSPFATTFSFNADKQVIENLYHHVVSAIMVEGDTFSDALKRNACLYEFMSIIAAINDTYLSFPIAETTINPIAKSAMSYLLQNYFEDISIPEVARYCHIDQSYLIRLFKKQYNLTPKRALILIRLNQAVQLLLYSSLSITDIVYEVGFHSQVVFDRAFKKNFNVSPTEFRQTFLTYENSIIDHREDELLKLVKSKPARSSAT